MTAGDLAAAAGGGGPQWVRLTKIGGQFSTAAIVRTERHGRRPRRRATWSNAGLKHGRAKRLEVGHSLHEFGGLTGSVDFDFFDLTMPPAPSTTGAWTGNASAASTAAAIGIPSPTGIVTFPGTSQSQHVNVTFGPTADDRWPTTVFSNQAVIGKGFDVQQCEQVRRRRHGQRHDDVGSGSVDDRRRPRLA